MKMMQFIKSCRFFAIDGFDSVQQVLGAAGDSVDTGHGFSSEKALLI
jgi:hypothetical protein